jgi:hypothetical protein
LLLVTTASSATPQLIQVVMRSHSKQNAAMNRKP